MMVGQRVSLAVMPEALREVALVLLNEANGQRNAKFNKELAILLKKDDIGSSGRAGREGSTSLSKQLQQLRSLGWPVASDRRGIYLADAPGQLEATISDFRSRARKFNAAADALEHAGELMVEEKREAVEAFLEAA